LGAVNNFFVFGSISNSYKAKNGFLISLAEWAQKLKFLYTARSLQDSTKAFLNPLDFMKKLAQF
jgi:hypothetical protein